ncbi:polysaccharide biosynthesis/export family protein [Pedobacter sp. Leaf250]|uniref:polysaccharide biosynthesis/export family protein n=1 Tax=Pedobacter sp. Leaf250 TaxID=2876559 RepID=UPI001E612285|nr:polysaccharide biosynthesis/export family protein [Pedobacter sp. Leaf250]
MKQIYYVMILAAVFSSCGVRYKSVPYFQDLRDSGMVREQIKNYSTLKIQKGDILALTITSLNPEASAIFNMGNTSSVQTAPGSSQSPQNAANGFTVDQQGAIQMPLLGSINIEGFTLIEARDLIKSKLNNYLKEPVLSLRLVNFKVSILGDVANPGVYPIQNERVSVAEALSMAGDLSITALRNNVLLVREVQGERQYIRLNLQKKDLFNSPYYYLQNNDILYIQPSNAKYASVDSSYRNVGILLSVASIVVLLITQL